MQSRVLIPVFILMVSATALSGASLRLPAVLGDHMVLQQDTGVNLWGWSVPGTEVKVTTGWDNRSYVTATDSAGEWRVKVRTGTSGGPYDLVFRADTTILVRDVLLGEVWICSGQSNMEFPLSSAASALLEIPRSDIPGIRFFQVERRMASRPRKDLKGSWQVCTPETAKDFSAVGYFFGKYLHQQLGVPVGLINASWGGTPSESWTSREALQEFAFFRDALAQLYSEENEGLEITMEQRDSLKTAMDRETDFLNPANIGFREKWMQPVLDESEWAEVPCPAGWDSIPAIGALEGVAWMRTSFRIPDEWVGKSLILHLGPVEEMDVTYLNGVKVGSGTRSRDSGKERTYKIPAQLITSNEFTLAIRIVNTRGEGGLVGDPEQLWILPEGMEHADTVLLSGTWRCKVAYRFPELYRLSNPKTPTVLYNGMLYPLRNMTIKGAIWYQGESNVGHAYRYRDIFPAMIDDWRRVWAQGPFPFYFVQLAPYTNTEEYSGAELRESQFLTLSRVEHTGMAVTLDIGDPDDIHPANKRDVGKRLALWALANDYGREVVYSGPLYREQRVEGNSIRLFFDHTGSGLESREGLVTYLEIAGADRVYHPAMGIIDGNTLLVSSPQVPEPVAVRYGWRNTAEPNLFNREGLPASSFCTDPWPRVTEERKK
jgi:sialate O-acetylesterase